MAAPTPSQLFRVTSGVGGAAGLDWMSPLSLSADLVRACSFVGAQAMDVQVGVVLPVALEVVVVSPVGVADACEAFDVADVGAALTLPMSTLPWSMPTLLLREVSAMKYSSLPWSSSARCSSAR